MNVYFIPGAAKLARDYDAVRRVVERENTFIPVNISWMCGNVRDWIESAQEQVRDDGIILGHSYGGILGLHLHVPNSMRVSCSLFNTFDHSRRTLTDRITRPVETSWQTYDALGPVTSSAFDYILYGSKESAFFRESAYAFAERLGDCGSMVVEAPNVKHDITQEAYLNSIHLGLDFCKKTKQQLVP